MHADVGGVKVTRYMKKGCVDYRALLQDKCADLTSEPCLEPYRKKPREVSRFSLSRHSLINEQALNRLHQCKSFYF